MSAPIARESHPDNHIHELAASQHGVVTRRQLLEAGILRGAIEHRLEVGRLQRLHLGVYQVGPVRAPYAAELAAALACGEQAALSHRSVAALWKIWSSSGAQEAMDVTLPRDQQRQRPGIRAHRSVSLTAEEVTTLHGIRVTTPPRTLLDLAASEPPKMVDRALAEALAQHIVTRDELCRLIARHPHRPGSRLLRMLLEGVPERALTRPDAETLVRELMARAQLPRYTRSVGREKGQAPGVVPDR